ncbi:hypothetical protein Poly51_28580 [Rubripirellula tenax]|uniref:Spore protein YkvP/CgeB glycosyl transferase-like domain-containing protein n=1 Tax=Rubripirellula tenax TaxID=2528015 RepID=A0A5C6FBG1_9BACT|nr:glycosyltransferase [Rubripirellula tenax]TWU56939.1 hypothetical protein Poly51_28580 [Rubripirellula tenax]
MAFASFGEVLNDVGHARRAKIKGLVVGPTEDCIYQWMTDSLHDNVRAFRKFGLSLSFANQAGFAETIAMVREKRPQVLFITFDWREEVSACVDMLAALRSSGDCPKIVYVDTYDQTTTPFFPVLPFVDVYWKKQILNPMSLYNTNDWPGGNPLAEIAAKHCDVDVGDWSFSSPLPTEYADRVKVYWNLGAWGEISKRARHPVIDSAKRMAERKKSIDIFCRVSVLPMKGADPKNIYSAHRRQCLNALEPLEKKYKIESNRDDSKVPLKEFYRQLRSSRIALSPWGWGEVTDRDFRIVDCRALLIKPDTSHMLTDPNIYVPGETYIPVRWDLADLTEKCEYYLERPDEIRRITDNAFDAFKRFFQERTIEKRMQELLVGLKLLGDGTPAS